MITKDSTETTIYNLEDLCDKAVDSLVEIIKDQDPSAELGVQSTRSFAPGLTTTMVHPNGISRHAVNEEAQPGGEGITFEMTLGIVWKHFNDWCLDQE